ncbi:MAG: hypothetical protein WC635_05450 [Bacteriovorax sp.]|jgi:hypothetical protein
MKQIFSIFFCIFLSACASTKLIRYDKESLVDQRKDFKESALPKKFTIYLEKAESCPSSLNKGCHDLRLKLMIDESIKEEWLNTYSRIGIYEKQCRAWRDQESRGINYCDLDWNDFLISHLFLYGFLQDITIPFIPYNKKTIEVHEADNVLLYEAISNIRKIETPTSIKAVRLTIGQETIESPIVENVASFNFRSFKIDPDNLPEAPKVVVQFENQNLDVSEEYSKLYQDEHLKKRAIEDEAWAKKMAQDKYERSPEGRFKMPFCGGPQLMYVLTAPTINIQANCIYQLAGYPLRVLQVINQGVLITFAEDVYTGSNRTFLIKTKKQYVDGDRLRDMLVKSVGTISYSTVLGASKTIHAFEYLGD